MNNNNDWNQAKVPFFLEVEYYDEFNPDTESKIMKSLFRNEDLLPGLRVNKMFADFVDKDVLIANELTNDLKHLQEEFEKFKNKYINFADDRSKDNCINKLGMQQKINSETDRYKAYDDPTNIPT